MEKIRVYLLILLISLSFGGCIHKGNVPGVYVNSIKQTKNIDTIKIYKNGMYERFIYDKINKKIIFKNNGSWKFHKSEVILSDFLENYGGYTSENIIESYDEYLITFSFSVKYGLKGLCLRFNEKMNHCFCKK